MAAGTLYTYPESFRANKVLIAAKYSGADVKVDKSFKLGETNRSDAFLKKFPNGKVPAFEGSDGFCLTESNAIAYYVSNSQLHGENPKEAALVQQWINFSDNEILPAASTWTFPCLGIIQYNKQDTERAKQQLERAMKVLNDHLLTCTFLVGERVTLADISLVNNMRSLYELVFDPSFRKPYGNVNRWFTTLINQPQVKAVLGEVKLATTMATFDNKKYQELHGGGDKKGKKKDQPAQQKKEKKEEKATPKPKAQEEDDEPAPRPPAKDPFADRPKGTMDLDAFKREYSNKDTLTEALPYFWKHLDKEVYSIWYSEYKESTADMLSFMSSNLVRGMFQRLEKLRKHAFASVMILGEDKKNKIQGIWVWRTKELVFPLCDDWTIDYESYDWKQLDIDSEETKELVKKYFVQEGDFGDEIQDALVYK